jgi:hypothetical protein
MKRRTVYVLAGVFLALVALIALSRWSMNRPPALAEKPPLDFASLTRDSVDMIQVSVPSGGSVAWFTTRREGAVWRLITSVPGRPTGTGQAASSPTASATKITNVFDTLAHASFERLISKDATDLAAYGLTTMTATRVMLDLRSKRVADFLVGGETDVPQTNYVRFSGRPEVWAVSGGLKDVFGDTSGWSAPAAVPPGVTPPPAPAKP